MKIIHISNKYIICQAVRNIIWNVDNLRNFVDKNHGKEFDGRLCLLAIYVVCKVLDIVDCLMYLVDDMVMFILVCSAVIEHVRDGCTVRAFLLPDFVYVTLMLSGIKVCSVCCIMSNHLYVVNFFLFVCTK